MIKSKNKKCIICGSDKQPWFSQKRCKSCAIKSQYISKKIDGYVKKNHKPISKLSNPLVLELDNLFSVFIRKFYADKEEMVKCYTCSNKLHWTDIQNGHFHSRKNMATRWDENNCRPQCESCNMFQSGNLKVFAENLLAELGENKFSELEIKARSSIKLHDFELQKKIDDLTLQLSKVEDTHK